MDRKRVAELTAFYAYTIAVSFSSLGPIVHYSGWGVALLSLIYLRLALNIPILRFSDKDGRRILIMFFAMLAWIMLAGLLSFDTFHDYGRNVSVVLEMLLGIVFAVRLIATKEKRRRFIGIFVAGTVFILVGNLLRNSNVISYFPNHSLFNGNSSGAFGLFSMAPLVVFALWSSQNAYIKQLAVLLPVLLVIFFSFSSGAWLAAACCGLVFLWFGVKQRKINYKLIIVLFALAGLLGITADYCSHGSLYRRLMVEIDQVMTVDDVRKLTNDRNEIWKASLHMLSQHPVTGWAGTRYEKVYKDIFDTQASEVGLKYKAEADHPHSTFLYILYLGGIPGLILFLGALCLLLKKSLYLARDEKDASFAWGVMSVALLVAVLVNGLTGDVFQGRRDIAVMVWGLWGIIIGLERREDRDAKIAE